MKHTLITTDQTDDKRKQNIAAIHPHDLAATSATIQWIMYYHKMSRLNKTSVIKFAHQNLNYSTQFYRVIRYKMSKKVSMQFDYHCIF